jgi:hypothetical protein
MHQPIWLGKPPGRQAADETGTHRFARLIPAFGLMRTSCWSSYGTDRMVLAPSAEAAIGSASDPMAGVLDRRRGGVVLIRNGHSVRDRT